MTGVRRKLSCSALLLGLPKNDIQKTPEQTILNDTLMCPNGRSTLNRVEMAYAREAYNYNNLELHGLI
uniref:Uncharacterized protein n=1 Tax=Megaselia scalaris TaxID=36166 RepID=T1H2U3_MEGSC